MQTARRHKSLALARFQHLQESPDQMHAPSNQHHDLFVPLPSLRASNVPTPRYRLLNTPLHLHDSRRIDPAPRVRQTPLHLQSLDSRRARVHTHEIGPVPFLLERDVSAEHGMREGLLVMERGSECAVEGSCEGISVAGLLVEEEDAGPFRGTGVRDLRGQPRAGDLDAFERVPAVDVPCDVLLATGLAAAGPAHLFETADELWWKFVVGLGILLADGDEVGFCDGYGEAGVGFLEVGGQAELDVLERWVSVNDMELCRDLVCALSEDLNGSGRVRGCKAWSASFHYSTLMPRNFLNGISQHSRVIDPQARDASDSRLDQDVRAIVFPTNAAFNYRSVDTLAHVRMICHQRQEPEVGWLRGYIWRLAFRRRGLL